MLSVLPMQLSAQEAKKDTATVTRTVVVEQEYTPDILDARKINVMPKIEPLKSSEKRVVYDTSQSPATEFPFSILPIYTAQEMQGKALPGYVRLGMGLPGNVDFLANYRLDVTDKDLLNFYALFNGNQGDRKFENGSKWENARFFQTRAGIDYAHSFDRTRFDLGAHLGVSNFNLLPSYAKKNQNFTSGDIHVGVSSADDNQSVIYHAETNVMLYQRGFDLNAKKPTEVAFRTEGDILVPLENQQSAGIAFRLDNLLYNKIDYKNNHHADLNPYYVFENSGWYLHLGAHANYSFGLRNKLRMAPDVKIQYSFSNSYAFYANATGGNITNDFRRLELLSPYGLLNPSAQLGNSYEQVNAAIGIKGSPANGLWFNLFGGYQDLKDDADFRADKLYNIQLYQANLKNIYGGAELSYTYKEQVSFNLSGLYRRWNTPQNGTAGAALSYFKPVFEGNFLISDKITSSSELSLGLQYTARKGNDLEKPDAIANLYISGNYNLFKGFSIYARANNLLNKRYQYFSGVPAQGINFVGGISYSF